MTDILLVEDNTELAELMQAFLEKSGYCVRRAASGEEALACMEKYSVKVLLLDIMLPGMDGFAVCRAVRRKGNLPILILSARVDRADKLNGYELGADDYMEKPVDPDILTAKVNALVQRAYRAQTESDLMVSGCITIDRNARKVYMDGEELELNGKEYDLLLIFAANPGKTLHKEYLFNQVWGMDSFSEYQTLTVHVKMLRTKIERNPREPERIKTVWGVGYRYEEL